MDTRFFGNNLLVLNHNLAGQPRPSTETVENTYYRRHEPSGPSVLRLAILIGVLGLAGLGSTTVGIWLS